jgi:hypothetical protein
MEQKCYFVSSRGILKSCDFKPFKPISSSNANKRYLFLMLNNMFDAMSIYVCSDLLKFFVNKILPKINKKFVLISGDSDINVPQEALTRVETAKLITSPNLLKWFAQNTRIQYHPKIFQLPIGLDYHTISNNPNHQWRSNGEGYLPKNQENILVGIKENSIPFYERTPKIYVNFSRDSDRFGDRTNALDSIPQNLLEMNMNFMHRTQTWNNISNYAFVLSPFGNGMDCHRTWETLCLGSIPIVKAPAFKKLFEDLPVLNVDDWSDITQELLDTTLAVFKDKTFNYDKLTLKYWKSQIKRAYSS